MTALRTLQPLLHDLVSCVSAPCLVLSPRDGQLRGVGVHGMFVSDRRALHTMIVTVDGAEPEDLRGHSAGPASARFAGVVRALGDPLPDPTVMIDRHRCANGTGMQESIRIASTAHEPVCCLVEVALGTDLGEMHDVKSGLPGPSLAASAMPAGLQWLGADGTRVVVTGSPQPDALDPDAARLQWAVLIDPGESVTLGLSVHVSEGPAPAVGAVEPTRRVWSQPRVRTADPRLSALLAQSLADLSGLRLSDPIAPQDTFLAAGSPWFLTLFGRDSLWAARMMLPLGTEVAAGTLRALARRQGKRTDPVTEEQPGKIPHELRRVTSAHDGAGIILPALYYGTVDATALWVTLLHDAWRWGMPPEQVAPLLDAAEAALVWMRDDGTGANGFLEYCDQTGRGLVNQGWKDSQDSVRFADGSLAEAPVALCEVQAYAYEAAVKGAALLHAFDRSGAEEWLAWAAALQARFRARFWVDSPDGAFPAIAVDESGRAADSMTSNAGHLLGTGLLDRHESALVAARLGAVDMNSGFGLRTLSSRSGGFSPLSYHGGSVWPHDTAIAIAGLAADGHDAVAASLIAGLMRAAPEFDYQLPELFGGEQAEPYRLPLPYPAACRPQAWSAASVVVMLNALVGINPDVPGGRVRLRPLSCSPFGSLDVTGLRVGAADVSVSVDGLGGGHIGGLPDTVQVTS